MDEKRNSVEVDHAEKMEEKESETKHKIGIMDLSSIGGKSEDTDSDSDIRPDDDITRVSADDKVNKGDESDEKEHSDADDRDTDSVESDINICISDTKLSLLKPKLTFTQRLQKLFGVQKQMTQIEFEEKTKVLYKCCLKSVRDLHELHLKRILGMEVLDDIILRAKPSHITISHVIHITWSIMSCIHHFQLRLRSTTSGLVSWSRRQTAEHCMNTYSKLIRLFKQELHRIILNAIITFYREGKLWEIEFACTELIVQLLEIYVNPEEGIEDTVFTIESATLVNVQEAKYLTQVLYEILKKIKWQKMSEYLMKKFLSMLDSSIVPRSTDEYNYYPLRKGLEICVKNTIINLSNKDLVKLLYFILKRMNNEKIDEEVLLNFGNMAAYAASKYRHKSLRKPVAKGPLPLIFRILHSKNPLLLLQGTRIWQNLTDRNNNSLSFISPRIYFQDCSYPITIIKCKDDDRAFFKSVRHLIYEISMGSFMNSTNRIGLENTYQAIALTIVEIPCGYTASCFVTVAMSLQEYAFSISKDDLVRSHHLHAIVLSMLTLICYVHNATVFYDYVNTILERRAEWAPHLNPPLKASYEYAQHHILWNKPELFFEDWEARYGLWKCFRVKRK